MEAYAVHIKGLGKDENGFQKVIWLTESQADVVTEMRNDVEKRHRMVEVGNYRFSPIDVMFMEKQKRDHYDLPKYFLDRKRKEQDNLIESSSKPVTKLLN